MSHVVLLGDSIFDNRAYVELPLLDLRVLCDQPEDYAAVSPIEPSVQGGEKIAAQIAYVLEHHDFADKQSIMYGVLP